MAPELYALRQMGNMCNIKTLKTIYFSLIHPHMAYGISIYGATANTKFTKILLQQKRALKLDSV